MQDTKPSEKSDSDLEKKSGSTTLPTPTYIYFVSRWKNVIKQSFLFLWSVSKYNTDLYAQLSKML